MDTRDKIALRFTHRDGTTRTFRVAHNPLTDSWLYSFDDWDSAFSTNKHYINTVVQGIKRKATNVVDLLVA